MFERFTEPARRSVYWSLHEAKKYGSASIETEHLLLGLLQEHPTLKTRVSIEAVRKDIEARTPPSSAPIPLPINLPLSEECKRALANAAEEAEASEHKHIEPQHLVIGLLRQEDCFATRLLRQHWRDIESSK